MLGISSQISLIDVQVTKTLFPKNVLKNEREKVQIAASKQFILKKILSIRMLSGQITEETIGQNKRSMIFHRRVTDPKAGNREVILEERKTNFNQTTEINKLLQQINK